MCVSSKLPSSLIEFPLCPSDDTCNSTHAARHSKFQKLDAPRTVDRLGSKRPTKEPYKDQNPSTLFQGSSKKRGSCDPSRKPASPDAQHPKGWIRDAYTSPGRRDAQDAYAQSRAASQEPLVMEPGARAGRQAARPSDPSAPSDSQALSSPSHHSESRDEFNASRGRSSRSRPSNGLTTSLPSGTSQGSPSHSTSQTPESSGRSTPPRKRRRRSSWRPTSR